MSTITFDGRVETGSSVSLSTEINMNEQDEGTFTCQFLLKTNQDCFFYHHWNTDVDAWRHLVDVGWN